VKYLGITLPKDLAMRARRYEEELRPVLGYPEKGEPYASVWIDAIEEERVTLSTESRVKSGPTCLNATNTQDPGSGGRGFEPLYSPFIFNWLSSAGCSGSDPTF